LRLAVGGMNREKSNKIINSSAFSQTDGGWLIAEVDLL